ncbi:tetratricopeptide repeat protein [Parasphingopyxis sp. CP4]|uniref:tetratricopeptide repeat protein n=1 Tax=Parasphingopyxis sp. CP4 TaxID=2724527 RepID=UPI0015A33EB0|nr:tetratricopeptide repeat protein [Parasphingopyxis sp. CP4]QLC21600.1 tetratricopeptide repeat protein [Parasphingopyxis sp. CP4]
MRRSSLVAGLALITLASGSAHATISVFGNTTARTCYESALNERSGPSDISTCTEAIQDRNITGRDRVASYVNRGILHVQNGNFERAIADYDEAIELDENEPEAYLNKGLALLHQRAAMTEVVALLTAAIENGTREPALAYYGRGVAHEMNGDVSAAYFDIQRASDLDPDWDVPARDLTRFRVVGGQGG